MYWSTIYDETGDDEREMLRVTSRLDAAIEIMNSEGKYNKTIMYVFTVNYILGVGYLGIPYVFERVGILLGTIIMIFTTFLCWITVLWVAEAAHRGRQLIEDSGKDQFPTWTTILKTKMNRRKGDSSTDITPVSGSHALLEYSSMEEILRGATPNQLRVPPSPGPQKRSPTSFLDLPRIRSGSDRGEHDLSDTISGLEPEVVDLANAFLGPLGKVIYQCALVGLTFSGMLFYFNFYNGDIISARSLIID